MAQLVFKVRADYEKVVKLRDEISKLKQELKGIDSTQSPDTFNALNGQLRAANIEFTTLTSKAAQAGATMENVFKKKVFDASQVVNDLSQNIINQKSIIKNVEADIRKLGDAYQVALKRNPMSASGKLSEYNSAKRALEEERATLFGLTQDQANARLSIKKLRDEYALYKSDVQGAGDANKQMSLSFGKIIGVIGGAAAVKQLGSEIIRVRGEFQAMQTNMETMVGKEMAESLTKEVKNYAKISPLTLSDMSKAQTMMLGFDIPAQDTVKYLKALGDVSMGNSQKFNSLTLAFSQMSATGKLMGQDLNQMINAGFNPLTIMSEKSGKSIAQLKNEMSKGAISTEMVQQAFLDATSAGGKFYNMSENASKEMNGQISMMEDAWEAALNNIGANSEGVIISGIRGITGLIENYETVGKVITGLVATYGVYRTAIMLSAIATSKHTLAEVALTNVRIVARKAQMALNAAMLTNPYVAIAVALAATTAAVWALSDSSTEAERAQKRFNESQKEAANIEQEHKQRIDSLIDSSRDIAMSDTQRGRSLAELRKEYPSIFSQYDIESIKLADILKLKQQISEEDGKRRLNSENEKMTNLDSEIKKLESMLFISKNDSYDRANQLKLNQLKADRDVILKERGKNISEQFITNLKGVDLSDIDRYVAELEKKISGQGEDAKIKMKLPIDIKGALSNEAIFDTKDIKTLINTAKATKINRIESEKNKTTYKQDFDKAKKDWEEAKKKLSDIEKDKSKFTTKQYEDAKKLRDTTEKSFKDIGGATGGALTKQENQAEKLRKESEKYQLLLKKQEVDKKRSTEDLQFQTEDARIKSLQEGSEKFIAQIKLNFEKEKIAIDRQQEDLLQKNIDNARSAFESNPQNKGKSFDSNSVILSDEELRRFETLHKNNLLGFEKDMADFNKKSKNSWNEYYKEFGTYLEKRKAIQDSYQDKISNSEGGEKMTLSKQMQNELDTLDNSVKNSTTLMGQLFADSSQKSVNEIQKIINNAELLMQYLGAKKNNDGVANIGGKEVTKQEILNLGVSENTLQNLEVSTEEVEALGNAINKLKGDLGGKSPFKLFETQVSSALKKIKKGGGDNLALGISEIGSAASSFAPAVSQFGNDLGNIIGNDDLGNKISGIASAIGGLGQTASGVGQIMSGDIVGGVMSTVSGISSLVTSIEGLFGANYDKYNRAKEEYESYIDILDSIIGKQKEMIASLDAKNAVKSYEYAKTLVEKSSDAARSLGKERLNSGASKGSHSIGVRTRDSMSSEGWDQAKKALGSDFSKYKIDDGRMTGLFDLSAKQLEKLQQEAPTFWAKLDGDVKEYLSDIIAANKSAEDLKETLNENLTGISFDSLFGNFVDSLYDMEASAEDISDDMADYMRKSLIKSFAVSNYQDKMKGWYEKWAEAMKDGKISASEQTSLDAIKDSIITGATESAKMINEQFGFLNENTPNQSATKRGFEAMSQETGSELNGRFTDLQMTNRDIREQNIQQSKMFSILTVKSCELAQIGREAKDIATETRSILVNSYLELMQISQNTGAIIKPIKEMNEKLDKIRDNTDKL